MKVQKMDSNFIRYINNFKILILKEREIRQQELKNERESQWSELTDKWWRKEDVINI
jgi:hypothetical protein